MSESSRQFWRYLFAALGLCAFGLALVPSVTDAVPITAAVDVVGTDYALVGSLAAVALSVLGWMLAKRATEQVVQATPPDPETVPDAPRPGTAFDDVVGGWPILARGESDRLRERLRVTAVRAEMQRHDISREQARARVVNGEWTDDDVATRFLAATGPSVGERLQLVFRGDSWTQYGARATASALGESISARRTAASEQRPDDIDRQRRTQEQR